MDNLGKILFKKTFLPSLPAILKHNFFLEIHSCDYYSLVKINRFNLNALRLAKTQWSCGHSECNRISM